MGDVGTKSKSGLRNGSEEHKSERENVCNLCRNQIADDVHQEGSRGKLQPETANKGTDMVEGLPTLDLDTNCQHCLIVIIFFFKCPSITYIGEEAKKYISGIVYNY